MGEMIKYGIKLALTVSAWLAFFAAIQTILNLISSLFFANVISEIFSIVSMCLPFNATIVFGGIKATMAAILAFIVARRLYVILLGQQMANG